MNRDHEIKKKAEVIDERERGRRFMGSRWETSNYGRYVQVAGNFMKHTITPSFTETGKESRESKPYDCENLPA